MIQVNNFEDENVIFTYEQAAAQNSFDNDEIFTIYLKMNFNFNQLINAEEIYKNLPNYKARALIYQSMLLTDGIEKKINLAFLLKDLFIKDKFFDVYDEEFSNILQSIDPNKISAHLIPTTANTYDLGSTDRPWRDVHLSGSTLVIGGTELESSELTVLDGVTTGTVSASKAVIVDANKDINGFRNDISGLLALRGAQTEG